MSKLKVLLWDIETSHDILAAFGLFHGNGIPHTNVLQNWYIICAAWKWLDGRRVYAASVLDDPARFKKDPNDDYYVVKVIHEVLSNTDVLVHHYGDRFDIKKFNTRCLFHGLKPVKPLILVDTYKMAKKAFSFVSNRLDFIDKYLGGEGKHHTSSGLWLSALQGNKKAIKEMVVYNKEDVRVLERVYLKLRPFTPTNINHNIDNNFSCPTCGSTNLHSHGYRRTKTRLYRRYQCQDCGSWSSDTISDKSWKAALK